MPPSAFSKTRTFTTSTPASTRKKKRSSKKTLSVAAKDSHRASSPTPKCKMVCARVGQTKLFAKNFGNLENLAPDMRSYWIKHARYIVRENPEIDLHLHCVSTVASADEMHSGKKIDYWHQDEMWVWIPFTDLSIEHLKLFLNAFKKSPQMQHDSINATFYGSRARDLATLFQRVVHPNSPPLRRGNLQRPLPFASSATQQPH